MERKNMENRKRKMAALFMAAGFLVCAGNWQGTKAEAQSAHEPITICRLGNLIKEDFLDALHEAYPEINVEIVPYLGNNRSEYAKRSLEEDDMTDIYVSTRSYDRELQPDRLVDLSNYDFVNHYSTSMLNSLDIDGGIYLLPTGYTWAGINYNKTLMEENGWEVPENFEELLELKEKIEAAGYRAFANAIDLDGYPFNYFFSLGNTLYFSTQEGVQWKDDFSNGRAQAAGNEKLQEVIDYYSEWIENGMITNEHMGHTEYQECGDTVFFLSLGLGSYQYEAEDGKVYEFGIMPWLSRDGSNNMMTRSVERYFGINKHLEEPGNEQKLEDALKVMEFIASEEGQQALATNSDIYFSPMQGGVLEEGNPYYEVQEVINSGHSVEQVYVGWENLIVPLAQDLRQLITGDITKEELPEKMDETYQHVMNEGTVLATLTETLSFEETARLCAIAQGKAADADCALVSINGYHGRDRYDMVGAAWFLWAGDINADLVNMIRPYGTEIVTIERTGAEIKKMQEEGFDATEEGDIYEYVLVTKNGMELEDDVTYKAAFAEYDLSNEAYQSSKDTGVSPENAIIEYVKELGTFGPEDIVWEE